MLATGHYRNGVLLTPVTADVISSYVVTGELAEIARPFTIDRFHSGARTDPGLTSPKSGHLQQRHAV